MSVYESSSNYPSEAWLFAQLLLGKAIPAPPSKDEVDRDVASICDSSATHHFESRSLSAIENSSLAWAARISDVAAMKLRSIQLQEDAARSSYVSWQRYFIRYSAILEDWNEAEHPRHPKGTPVGGRFAPKNGGVQAGATSQPASSSSPGKLAAPSANASAPSNTPAPTTKTHLPANHRGTWVSGEKGNGVFRYNNSPENQGIGLAGKEVRFENDHIAVGGFPAETYYGGSAAGASVEIDNVAGTTADALAADEAMRKKLGNKNWNRPAGYRWNHAGEPGSKTMELVQDTPHRRIAHKGSASVPRAHSRANRGRSSARSLGALTVYMTARDTFQSAGALQPDYEISEREVYHFQAEDGSTFVVHPGGAFSSPRREYVDGPRKGESEEIDAEALETHRKQAEEEFGKYIPGTIFREPRFIPGRRKKSIPFIIEKDGLSYDAGWIDEAGVHYHSHPILLPI